ncbi:hypothetical protein AVEN_221255-1 [Araneus ventricosus]|uniref:C2H2-type domain-containing protein n=1 Tax=Araneus ventricosus TaxID=182803 RepID=A0A4Y2LTJ2_ARAVE|nr:hypothetical protein AVEN_221255-1 [Araneus ventricosus]
MSNKNLRSGSSPDTDQRMFSCDTCGERFWIKSKLDKHILSHAETVFSCNTCNESFSSYSDLDLHSRLHKRTDQSNQCLDCKTYFADRSELLYHVHITHPDHSLAKNEQPKTVPLEKKAFQENVIAFPKIVQVGTLLGNSKPERNPIIFGVVGKYPGSSKSNSSFSGIKPILKTSDTVTIQKVNRPLSWKDPIDVDAKHHQPAETPKSVKRTSDFSQKSPRKQQKVNHFPNVKQDTMANISVVGQGVVQSQPLRLIKNSPMSKISNVHSAVEKCKMPSAATTVIRVGETTLSPVSVQESVITKKQIANPIKTVIPSILPNWPNPAKGLTVVQVHNTPDKKVGTTESQNISINQVKTTSSPKIIINLSPQGGLIQPGQQLISANLFAGKTFIIQKSPNTVKGSGDNVGSLAQFVKQRVLVNPVPSPKPPVQLAAVQPVVLASPGKQLLSTQKPQQENSTISKSTGPQNVALASSHVSSKTPKRIKLPEAKRLNLHKAESSCNSPEKASLSVVTSLPQNPSASLMSRVISTVRSGQYGRKYAPKKISSGNIGKNGEDATKLLQAKIKFSPKKMNSIDSGNLTSLKVVLPIISLKKLPDSVYEECIRNGFINLKNLNKKFLAESKKAIKMKSKNTIEVNPISTNDQIQNVKVSESNIGRKEKVASTPRRTRSAVKMVSDVEIHNINALGNAGVQNLKAVQNISSLNVQDLNMKGSKQKVNNTENVISPTRKTRYIKNTNQSLPNQQSRNIKPDGLNFSNNDNLGSPTLQETKQSVNMATPISPDMKAKKLISIGDETVISLTKRYSRKSVNAEKVNQILSTGQVQNMKTCENISVQSIESSDIAPVPNVKTNELSSTTNGIASSPAFASSISKPIRTSSVAPPSAKVQIMKAGENVKVNELNFVNDRIPSSPALSNNTLKSTPSNVKVVPVTADFMKKLKESLLKSSPCADSNNIRVVVPSEVLSKIQVLAAQTVLNTNIKTVPECSASSVITPVTVPFRRPSKTSVKNFENVDEMLQDEKRKREEKEKIKKKEKILKKMLVKYEEKEERKQVKYFQKKLSRFIEKNRDHLLGSEEKLFEVISNSSKIMEELKGLKHASETEIMNQLVTNVMLKSLMNNNSSGKSVDEAVVRKERQKKSVQGFVNVSTSRAQKKCDDNSASLKGKNVALKHSPVSPNPKSKNIFSSGLRSNSVYVYDAANETSIEDKADQASYSKSSNNTKKVLRKRPTSQKQVIKPFQEDPFTDMSIITGEKFTIECPCQNENCDGLHPEMTFF